MTSVLGLDFSKNLSFFTVPVAFLTALGPHLYAVIQAGKTFDNSNPRNLCNAVSKSNTIGEARKQRIIRSQACSNNGFETLGFFGAAVVAGNMAGLSPCVLNTCTIGYIASRIAFNHAYIFLGANVAWARTVIWQTGAILTMTLYVKAGLKLYNAYVF